MGNTLRELFSPPFYPGLIGIGWTIFLLLMVALSNRRKRKAEQAKPKDPDVQFLEDALDPDAPRKPNPNYSYAEFRRDLFDRGLTFNEIYEKCGGVFPKEPEPGQFGPQGYQGPIQRGPDGDHGLDYRWRVGPPGADGFQGSQGYQGPDGGRDQSPVPLREPCEHFDSRGKATDRMNDLQEWFKEQGKATNVGNVVPPPPNPYPTIHKIYIRGRR